MKKRTSRISRKAARRSFFAGVNLAVMLAAVAFVIGLVMHMTARTTIADDEALQYKYYTSITVQPGDSLWSIAEEHISKEYRDINAYIDEVVQINSLKSEEIKAGSHLCIPYYAVEYK